MEKVYFIHGNSQPHRFTIAAVLRSGKSDFTGWSLGLSICNPKDNYNRKLGNIIAKGRARKNPFLEISLYDNPIPILQTIKTDIEKLFTDYQNDFKKIQKHLTKNITRIIVEHE